MNRGGSGKILTDTSGAFPVMVREPGPNGELVGYSNLEPTKEMALSQARQSMEGLLQALVLRDLSARGFGAEPDLLEEATLKEVKTFLARPEAVAERFEEPVRLAKSGHIVYRAAVLVRVSPEWVTQTRRQVQQRIQKTLRARKDEYSHHGWTVIATVLLALATFLVYSFLNAGSKGHMAWTLRLISLTAFILLCFGLFYFRGYFP